MFQAVIADMVHPPLFYILLKLWISGGGASVVWMRLLPMSVSILTIPLVLWLCREFHLRSTTTIVAFVLVTFNSLLIRYSQELRMYSLLVFFSVASLALFVRLLNGLKCPMWLFTVVNSCMVYSHYYGFLFILTEALVAVIWLAPFAQAQRRVFRKFIVSVAIAGCSFLPWLYAVVHAQLSLQQGLHAHIDWIEVPTFTALVWFYEMLDGFLPVGHTTTLGLVLFFIPVVMAGWTGRRKEIGQMAVFAFLPVGLSFLASRVLPLSIFHPRYLIGSVIPYLFTVAVCVEALPTGRKVWTAALAAWAVWAGVEYAIRSDRQIAWERLAQELQSLASPIYAAETHELLPLQFYGVNNVKLVTRSKLPNVTAGTFAYCFRADSWRGPRPELVLRDSGYTVVRSLAERDRDETVIAEVLQKADVRRLQSTPRSPQERSNDGSHSR
jgi:uncharacterized membrane protein